MTTYTREDLVRMRHRFREESAGTQLQAAKLLGISLSYYQKLEAGERPITPELREKIRKFEGDVAYIVKEQDEVQRRTISWHLQSLVQHRHLLRRKEKKVLRELLEA